MSYRIERWNGQIGAAEQLARWHVKEWQNVFPEWTVQDAVAEFNTQLLFSELPATWLAFKDDVLIGSISALLEDAAELNDIAGPWLASFYIVPECRGKGIGQLLMNAAEQAVKMLGYQQWYLFTPHHESYYAKQGWALKEIRQLHNEQVAVMVQTLT
jgi:GNAT superfamily N-acetyltransferase